ncbi:hypothetical protein [Curtobacterium sp. MCBD17_019]|uniref:hypothetical protein n=1 Tax=Curtobacterium sp. MCBD17_019 TaxID=2175669 RepID=UPI000DA6DD7C|nr:hypothetical protein [Curtobacterium sp. MCBD17_019]PZE73899.1 hypothetical protein DEI82_12655 [Curtobacterium sp. MCBD17_019]
MDTTTPIDTAPGDPMLDLFGRGIQDVHETSTPARLAALAELSAVLVGGIAIVAAAVVTVILFVIAVAPMVPFLLGGPF